MQPPYPARIQQYAANPHNSTDLELGGERRPVQGPTTIGVQFETVLRKGLVAQALKRVKASTGVGALEC